MEASRRSGEERTGPALEYVNLSEPTAHLLRQGRHVVLDGRRVFVHGRGELPPWCCSRRSDLGVRLVPGLEAVGDPLPMRRTRPSAKRSGRTPCADEGSVEAPPLAEEADIDLAATRSLTNANRVLVGSSQRANVSPELGGHPLAPELGEPHDSPLSADDPAKGNETVEQGGAKPTAKMWALLGPVHAVAGLRASRRGVHSHAEVAETLPTPVGEGKA